VVAVEAPGEGLDQGGMLGPHAPLGQPGEDLGVALAGDEGSDHGPAGDAEDVGRDARDLYERVFEQFLDALLVPGALLDQVGPEAGVVTQGADLGWGDETRP
jgi:hypothetical protein